MQFKSIWLYTLLTVVSTVVCCRSFAADPVIDTGSRSDKAIQALLASCDDPKYGYTDPAAIRSCADKVRNPNAPSAANDCNTLKSTLTKEDSEFKAACTEVGRSGNSCDEAYYGCNECSGAEGDSGDKSCDSTRADSAEERGSSRGSKSQFSSLLSPQNYSSHKTERDPIPYAQFAYCPSIALNQIESLKDELKEFKAKKTELDKDISQKKIDITEVESDISTAESTYQDDKNAKETEYESKQQELLGALDEETKELTSKLQSGQQELTALMNNRDKLTAQYIEQVAAIENVCEVEAERELGKRREDYVKQLQGSRAVQKDISSLLRLRLKGRNNDDEEFRKRAVLRCQQNPARYQRPIQLLNNQYEINKRELEDSIRNKNAALQGLLEDIKKANPKAQEKLTKLQERYTKDIGVITGKRDRTIGTCGTAPGVLGAQQQQTGASGCTGLMKKKNTEEQSLLKLQSELQENADDISYTQELFDAARQALGGGTSGHKSAEDVSTGGIGVVSALEQLNSICGSDPQASTWRARIKALTGNDPPDPVLPPAAALETPVVPTGGATAGASAAGRPSRTTPDANAPATRPKGTK